jgi:hypothetical protein
MASGLSVESQARVPLTDTVMHNTATELIMTQKAAVSKA